MLKTQFFVRFSGQLHRTKPALMRSLENAVSGAASAAGGKVEVGRKGLTAFFDETRIGFWLDILIFLKKVYEIVKETEPELFGYALVLGYDFAETAGQKLSGSRSEKNGGPDTGIWCSREVRKALDFYAVFEKPAKTDDEVNDYGELREFRPFDVVARNPSVEKIARDLSAGKNTLLAGCDRLLIRSGIYHYSGEFLGIVPPLVVRFGVGGCGLVCFADAFTPEIRFFIAGAKFETTAGINPGINPGKTLEELDGFRELLFKERLREELSPYIYDLSSRFFRSLLSLYTAAAKTQTGNGLLILEDIDAADDDVPVIFDEAYSSLEDKLLVLAMSSFVGERTKNWQAFFSQNLNYSPEDFREGKSGAFRIIPQNFPAEICEIAYNIALLGRYFPVYLFPRLFEEEGLSRELYLRAVGIFAALGVCPPGDPLPQIPDFINQAEKILGRQKEAVRSAVRSRILAWTLSGKLRPCFNLLRIFAELGERASDALVLASLRADVLNKTWEGIEDALEQKYFATLAGTGNAPVLEFIYKTLKALIRGGTEEIRRIFREGPPPVILENGKPCYPGFQAQIQTNLAAYHIGSRNTEAASETVRKTMIINRELGANAVPAYRFFSLVNLSARRVDDALEYISFALDQAEKNEQSEELYFARYYASVVNFLYGNLSKAERLAVNAEEAASAFGRAGWIMRARFLRGRIYFEIGRYKDALDIFESIVGLSSGRAFGRSADMLQTVNAWIFRAGNFLGRFPSTPADYSTGLDGGVFEIEAAYRAADYDRAAALAEDFLSSGEVKKDDFFFTEQPDWKSGFFQCENLLGPEKVPAVRLAWIYRLISQCALTPSPEERRELMGSMQRYIRDELFSDTDPFDSFSYHAWFCMTRDFEDSGTFRNSVETANVDLNTILSMAVKRIQRRADRIDDNAVKQAFLTLSHWNGSLYLAARERKLI